MLRVGSQVLAQTQIGDEALVGVIESVVSSGSTKGEVATYRVRLASGERHNLPEGHLLALEMNQPSSSEEDDVPALSRPRDILARRFELPIMTASEDQNPNIIQPSCSTKSPKQKKRPRMVDSDEEEDEAFEEDKRAGGGAQGQQQRSQDSTSSQARKPTLPLLETGSLPPTQQNHAAAEPSQPRSTVITCSSSSSSTQPSEPGVNRILSSLASIDLPAAGLNGDVARLLLEANRPLGTPSIAQALKEKYTRTQIDKALASLVSKGLVESLEDSGKIFWFSQSILEAVLGKAGTDLDSVQRYIVDSEKSVQTKAALRLEAESRVKQLILAPSDEELATKTALLASEVRELETRLKQVDAFAAEAAKQGKSLAEFASKTNASIKAELNFYKRISVERRRKVMELVDRVSESKNLKPAARRELIEQIGLEMDPA